MEALTRLVTDSLVRHGFDRPVDPRRLQWSRWFRCDSPHSLLTVPSKPGIFALAEEVMDLGVNNSLSTSNSNVETAALAGGINEGNQRAESRRMLAVVQFSEDDDMAFTLDRMFTRINPMRDRLSSGKCFLRFVVIEDQAQRRSICSALNQWMLNSAEKASGIPSDFSSTLEVASVARTPSSATARATSNFTDSTGPKAERVSLDSGAAKNLHCPQPLPSGF